MFWIGLLIGVVVGGGWARVQSELLRDVRMEMKRLEREIEADRLQIAREERRAEALRVIQRNTEEAARNSRNNQ